MCPVVSFVCWPFSGHIIGLQSPSAALTYISYTCVLVDVRAAYLPRGVAARTASRISPFPAGTEQHGRGLCTNFEFRFMASNWPPPWLNDRSRDPEPGPDRYATQRRPDSAQLSLPMPPGGTPAGATPEIGLSQLRFEARSQKSHVPGMEPHGARSHKGYMPDGQEAAPAWPSSPQQYRSEIHDDPSTPMARGQQEHSWVPSLVPGSNASVPQPDHVSRPELVASHHKPATQEDIALLLELQCAHSHLIGAPDVLNCAVPI